MIKTIFRISSVLLLSCFGPAQAQVDLRGVDLSNYEPLEDPWLLRYVFTLDGAEVAGKQVTFLAANHPDHDLQLITTRVLDWTENFPGLPDNQNDGFGGLALRDDAVLGTTGTYSISNNSIELIGRISEEMLNFEGMAPFSQTLPASAHEAMETAFDAYSIYAFMMYFASPAECGPSVDFLLPIGLINMNIISVDAGNECRVEMTPVALLPGASYENQIFDFTMGGHNGRWVPISGTLHTGDLSMPFNLVPLGPGEGL